ncbi:iporin isoform X4 [Xiphias gladius]|uniref:iporin isoform X4 n=1 Tax=Xiphias gladius TaxID=8245 RepID=UPI001A99869B|nr:iporin isoform X4 [Xiphias gladius]
MDSPPKLSGETLIVHHIPLVHCQVSGGRQGGCGGSLKRSNPFSPPENLGLSRTTSLPERDILQREALLYSSLIQTSSGSWSSHNGGRERNGGGGGGSTASDDSSFTSSNSEDQLITAHTLPRAKPRSRNPLRHNPFLLNTEDGEEEEEEEDDGDNLSGYLEDSSFHLHSDTNCALDDGMAPFRLHDLGFASEPFRLHSSVGRSGRESLRGVASGLSNRQAGLGILGLDSQRRHGSSGSNISMDCGEQDWGDDDEEDEDHPMRCGRSSKTGSYLSDSSTQHCSCCALSQNYPQHFPEAFPEPFSECQQGYGSDSSCNSSDGVLVNFSAIYNKMNNAVPEKPPVPGHTNLNSSIDHSGTSSVSDPSGNQRDSTGGAFYLDLHTSPTEPPLTQQQPSSLGNIFPLIREQHLSTSSTCPCSVEHQGALDLDANCNSYHPTHSGSSGDLASCLQSQARLVVATQNYYKLVTCDLSSQSSPSPAGSSVNSCSDEHSKGSPTPTQPSEYFLFRQQAEEEGVEEEDEDGESSRGDDKDDNDNNEEEEEEEEKKKKKNQQVANGADAASAVIEGQVYVNISPPVVGRVVNGGGTSSGSRPRSRSYDRNLDKSPSPRLGSLERMLSCPVRLSEGGAPALPTPPRVTSFAEIARSKRRNGGTGGSPSLKAAADPFSSTHSHSSVDFSPILEQRVEAGSQSLSPVPFTRCYSQGSIERHLEGARETRTKAEVGQAAKLQQSYNDFLPDYFSLTEKPPEEFCLSPDSSTSSSSCSSSQSHVSVDLTQKRGLVKAVNTAVDLIVAHFGTSRDPDVKAKLGNSWVSPNVGHLILKYLCPALHEVLQDGLKAYVLDLIIGQRRCQPWSLVEASTQLGPSTRVLHSLFSKVSQYSELTSHSMRLNAFIFGLLNLKSLEFWFSHLYTHEDIIAAHYNPWGFLPLSQGACQPLFEELLLLLQPLSLLPFDLDLLFEPHLLQKGQEHLRRKEQLCSAGQSVDQSARSTFQLMRGWSTTVSEMVGDSSAEVKRERAGLRREGTWPTTEGAKSRREGAGVKSRMRKEGGTTESMEDGPVSRLTMMEVGFANLWKERGTGEQRVKGVGQENQGEGEDGQEKDRRKKKDRDPADEGRQRQDRQAGWWYQLMQSSQVYIDQSTEGSKFVKTERRRKSSERRQSQLPPTREGVVEGAESSQDEEGYRSRESNSSSSGESAGSRGRPSWMGSPPESVLNQEKETKPPEVTGTGAKAAAQEESPSQGQSLRWGRLFGSSVGSPSRVEGAEQRSKGQKTRPPSGWLGLDRSVLDLVAQTIGAGSGKKAEPPATLAHAQNTPPPTSNQPAEAKQRSTCEVRALCHHIATEPGQLSFNKGDILRVLSKADPDWLLCSLGSTQGLVPIIYVTLKSMEDSQEATGLGQCRAEPSIKWK